MSNSSEDVIRQTKNWLNEIVIGLNLCPFAARPFNDNNIDYIVASGMMMASPILGISDEAKENQFPLVDLHVHTTRHFTLGYIM